MNDREVYPLLRHDTRGQVVRELEVNAEAFAARGCRSSQLGEGSGGDGTLGQVRGRVKNGLELLSGIEDGFVNVGAATVGKQDAALLSRVSVAQQGGGRGFAVGGKPSGAGSGEDGEADTEVGGVAGARLGGAGAAMVSVDIKGHGSVVGDATDVAAVVPVHQTVVPNSVLGKVEMEAAPGNELLGAEAVQAGPGGGAEDAGGQAAGGDGEEVGDVGGGEVGGGSW